MIRGELGYGVLKVEPEEPLKSKKIERGNVYEREMRINTGLRQTLIYGH